MSTHVVSYCAEPDGRELVDVDYQCSRTCMLDTFHIAAGFPTSDLAGTVNLPDGGSVSWGVWPCGSETDYDVYCSGCGVLLWHGLESEKNQ
jgi:hypothetical protein